MKLYDYDGFIWLIGTILIAIFVNVLLLHLLSLVYEKDANLLVVQLGFAERKVHENAEHVEKDSYSEIYDYWQVGLWICTEYA